MSLNQDLRLPANIPGVDTPTKGDADKLIRLWAKNAAEMLVKNAAKAGYQEGKLEWGVDSNGITFSFPSHMKYRDMKFLFWAGLPNVDALEKWVKKKGVNNFSYVPGYGKNNSSALSAAPDAARRIAWGLARSMASAGEPVNNYAKYKRKKIWQNPGSGKSAQGNLGTSIGHLVHLIEDELAQIIPNVIAYTFSQTK